MVIYCERQAVPSTQIEFQPDHNDRVTRQSPLGAHIEFQQALQVNDVLLLSQNDRTQFFDFSFQQVMPRSEQFLMSLPNPEHHERFAVEMQQRNVKSSCLTQRFQATGRFIESNMQLDVVMQRM